MSRISSGLLVAGMMVFAGAVAAQQPYGAVAAHKDDDHVTVTGCVVRGTGGYLLTNVAEGRYDDKTTRSSTFPPPTVAPSGQLAQVLYWFDNDDKLEGHEGERVQVEGKLEGELKKGEMEIERKGDRVELEAKAGGRKVKAVLPESEALVGTTGSDEKKVEMNYLVRRFKVKSVKTITSICQ